MWTPRCFFTSETSAQSNRELIRAPYFQSAIRDQQTAAQVKKSTQSTTAPIYPIQLGQRIFHQGEAYSRLSGLGLSPIGHPSSIGLQSSVISLKSSVIGLQSSVICCLSSVFSHPSSVVRHPSSVVCHRSSVIRHLSSVISHQLSVIGHQSSVICHQSSVVCHLSSVIRHLSSIGHYSERIELTYE